MPKDTFYHLSDDKKERILDAAEQELARVPISEMSINKIIQSAGISRGSFYQYFEDKNDLVMYMMADYIEVMKEGISKSMERHQGNIFEATMYILHGVVKLGKNQDSHKVLEHIMVEATAKFGCCTEKAMALEEEILAIFVNKIDRKILAIETDKEVVSLVRLIFSMLKDAAARSYYGVESSNLVLEELNRQLKFIKRGVEKERS